MSDSDDKPGYGKPPAHTRFKSGQSGNPKGRPKGLRNFKTDLREELGEMIHITEQGKKKRISKQQLLVKQLGAKAAKGDVASIKILLSLVEKYLLSAVDEIDKEEVLAPEDEALLDHYLGKRVQS